MTVEVERMFGVVVEVVVVMIVVRRRLNNFQDRCRSQELLRKQAVPRPDATRTGGAVWQPQAHIHDDKSTGLSAARPANAGLA